MKKVYIAPATEVNQLESQSMLMVSIEVQSTEVNAADSYVREDNGSTWSHNW